MMVGYARVSTDEQNADLQIDALINAGCEEIFSDDGVSGSRESRPALDRALSRLEPGDTLVTWKLDRLGRSLFHLIRLVADLEARGVAFRSLSEAIDTGSASGRLLFHVMGALAEFERALIGERTKAGLAAARQRGRILGRPPKLSLSEVQTASALLQDKRRLLDVADQFSVSPLTLRRALANLRR